METEELNKIINITKVTDIDYERISEMLLQKALEITEVCHPECVAKLYHILWAEYESKN